MALFNRKGIDAVNTRDIAARAGISLGNLTYYFPAKGDIVHALCLQLVEDVSGALNEIDAAGLGLFQLYYKQVEVIFRTQLRFRFILNKRYAEILTSVPEMQRNYQTVLKDRFNQFAGLHAELVRQKLAKPSLSDNSHGHFYILNMLATYWQQEAEIYFPWCTDEQKLNHALAVYFQTYVPYLTAKGAAALLPSLTALQHYGDAASSGR